MLIFSRAEVPTYRRGRAGDGGHIRQTDALDCLYDAAALL